MNLVFQKFQAIHLKEYQLWFKDHDLQFHLGPMNSDNDWFEWLEIILTEKNGCTYAVFQEEQLVAVINFVFPDEKSPEYFITEFAVCPELRGKGIGKAVLKYLAVVSKKNPKAKRFFQQNGWQQKGIKPDEHGMYLMERTNA